jgi:hypothetical protein
MKIFITLAAALVFSVQASAVTVCFKPAGTIIDTSGKNVRILNGDQRGNQNMFLASAYPNGIKTSDYSSGVAVIDDNAKTPATALATINSLKDQYTYTLTYSNKNTVVKVTSASGINESCQSIPSDDNKAK